MWSCFLLFGVWAVADRFIGPMMFANPDGGFMPPPCFQGSHCLNAAPLASNMTLSVQVFDIYQRATGRLFVAVTPFLIMLQCKTTENWFAEHHPKWLNVGDLRTTNNRIHYQMGLFFLTIPMLIHMWIFFVPILAGVPFIFLRVGDEAPHGSLNPFVAADGSMFMLPEDLLRLPLAIITFMFLLPISIGNYCRRRQWNTSHWLHIIAAAVYTMDYLRGNHPHAQLWTAPIVIYFFVDRMVGIFWYRSGKAVIIHNKALDDEYSVVFLYAPNQVRKRGIGSLYYYGLPGKEGFPRFSHAYTSWQNRGGEPLLQAWNEADTRSSLHKFFVQDVDACSPGMIGRKLSRSVSVHSKDKLGPEGLGSDVEDFEPTVVGDRVFFTQWDTAFIAQVHPENRGTASFTSKLAVREPGAVLNVWGPYYADYHGLNEFTRLPPLLLIATGAGANYLMDFYSQLTSEEDCNLANPVQVYFSTSSLRLFQFVTDYLCARDTHNWAVTAHLTQHDDALQYDEAEDAIQHKRQARLGRMSLEQTIRKQTEGTQVYFCGSPDIQWEIDVLCADVGLGVHSGNRFAPSGKRDIRFLKGGKVKCNCTSFPCCLQY